MTHLLTLVASFPFSQVSKLLNFIETRLCIFDVFDIKNYIEITQSVMPKPVYLLTMQEAHKEYNFLTDEIQAKYKQLDSGSMGQLTPQHSKLKAVNWQILLARASQLCQKLNLPTPKELYRPMFFKH